jgi:transposase
MFQDEARFGRINTPRKCWAPKGVRPIVGKQIVREYTYLYGAFSPKDGKADFLILPYMDSQCMSLFLKEISERYADEYVLIFWDGAPCHSAGKISIPANIMLDTFPPYSPDLNPSENIWDDMRENFFHNITFDSMKAVEAILEKAANFYENNSSIVKSITGWEWILSAL